MLDNVTLLALMGVFWLAALVLAALVAGCFRWIKTWTADPFRMYRRPDPALPEPSVVMPIARRRSGVSRV